MFKRKAYLELLKWKMESNGSTALLIEGARRIGKSTVAEELGKNEYPEYVAIDFSLVDDEFKKIFNSIMNIEDFFRDLFLKLQRKMPVRGSLIILDEIQFCPKARQAIKKLVKDGRYHYIETGSLVSIKENEEGILIPSEEESISMFPMDYEEFMWAIGCDYELDSINESYKNRDVNFILKNHQHLMNNYRLYLAVGGMPQAVAKYIETKDFYAVEKIKKNIIRLYEEDLNKIDNKYKTICRTVWNQIPSMLSKQSSRFIVSSIDERADSILFTNTLDKLIESKMVYVVYKTNEPKIGYALNKEPSFFKIYFSDVGLFTSIIYSQNQEESIDLYNRIIFNKLEANLGMLFENACAQALYANHHTPYYYSWIEYIEDKKKCYEIDFLIYRKGKIFPIEVKSNKPLSLKSIEALQAKYSHFIGEKYVVEPKPLKYGANTTYLPSYMLHLL